MMVKVRRIEEFRQLSIKSKYFYNIFWKFAHISVLTSTNHSSPCLNFHFHYPSSMLNSFHSHSLFIEDDLSNQINPSELAKSLSRRTSHVIPHQSSNYEINRYKLRATLTLVLLSLGVDAILYLVVHTMWHVLYTKTSSLFFFFFTEMIITHCRNNN